MNTVIGVLLFIGLLFLIIHLLKKQEVREPYTEEDKEHATKAVLQLHEHFSSERPVEEIDDNKLQEIHDKIFIRVAPVPQDQTREHFSFFHPVNNRYWPYYYYSFPYQYENAGAWPPGLYSRLYQWTPGFHTSGWNYWLRPGVFYNDWPRSRWVRHNDSYYYINN